MLAVSLRLSKIWWPPQVTRDELLEEDEYDDILKEVEEELETKYGKLAAIVMPQPSKKGPANDPAGVGLVFVRFEELPRAVRSLCAASQASTSSLSC